MKTEYLTRAQNFVRALDFVAPHPIESTCSILDAVADRSAVDAWTLCDGSRVVRVGDRFESRGPDALAEKFALYRGVDLG